MHRYTNYIPNIRYDFNISFARIQILSALFSPYGILRQKFPSSAALLNYLTFIVLLVYSGCNYKSWFADKKAIPDKQRRWSKKIINSRDLKKYDVLEKKKSFKKNWNETKKLWSCFFFQFNLFFVKKSVWLFVVLLMQWRHSIQTETE